MIVQQGDNAWLDVGSEAWRLPVPIVKSSRGWRFDMAAGEEEILTRAIGRNELSAIAAMHAYVDAQQDYYQLNHRWAQKIISSEGKKMVCTGPPRRAKRQVRLGPPLARRYPAAATMATASALSPVEMSRASPCWHGRWRETGVMSFMIDQHDTVYQANLGEESAAKARAITRFAPDADAGWQVVKP